jgi:SAM-dependent methyltransferase
MSKPRVAPPDKSNGYDELAIGYMAHRDSKIGAATVLKWSKQLPRGASILDLGCGHGVPISQVLIHRRFQVYGIDASAKMIAAFRRRFPSAYAEHAAVEDSDFFARLFDGVVAWGLLFLLRPEVQAALMAKVAQALNSGGKFLFTAPKDAVTWRDALTARESISLGSAEYRRILQAEGLTLDAELNDEGKNHYYFVSKP